MREDIVYLMQVTGQEMGIPVFSTGDSICSESIGNLLATICQTAMNIESSENDARQNDIEIKGISSKDFVEAMKNSFLYCENQYFCFK